MGNKNQGESKKHMADQIVNLIKQSGHQHLIEHYSQITNPDLLAQYQSQLQKIDYKLINQLYEEVFKHPQNKSQNKFDVVSNYIATLSDIKSNYQALQSKGLRAIAMGQAALCLMSGGQGTRLGSPDPKGMFDIGLQSKQTLFQYFSRRLQILFKYATSKINLSQEQKSKSPKAIPWYIMTSDINENQIKQFFHKHDYFGYPKEWIQFFPQGTIPAVDYNGKIIIQAQGKISLAPGGNGAIYYEMANHKKISDMRNRGVKYLHIGGIDNILLKLVDPLALGYMIQNQRDIVSKYTAKNYPQEKVGLHVLNNGKVQVCQYSELPQKQKFQLDNQGNLKFRHSFMANYFVTVDFIDKITSDQQTMLKLNRKYHIAEKKINLYDSVNQVVVKPTKNTGIKFELFCFDCFDITDKFALFEVLRQQEFAPVKNATGVDSPQSARNLISDLHKKWFRCHGIEFENEKQLFEIDVRLSYAGEGLQTVAQKYIGNKIVLPYYVKQE